MNANYCMTNKLFWDDPYLTNCKAKVTYIEGNTIKIDQTIFYAFSGGQESDEGTIGGIKVITATKQGDKENIIDIEYELEKDPDFKVGDEVEVIIDEEKRLKLMKLHTAVHLLYYFTKENLGETKIMGSNVSPDKARMDLLYEGNIVESIPIIEKKLNEFVLEDHEIKREADEKNMNLRWWECGEFKMPCGGTHVKSTKEIGTISLKRKTKGSGKERIEIFLEN